MIGKKNIVFGFIFFVFTVALGPLMVQMYSEWGKAWGEKEQMLGRLETLKADGFNEQNNQLSSEQIAKANTDGLLSVHKLINAENKIDLIKGGPHAHGNLESLLNIVVGVVLCFIAAPSILKQIISWFFIIGTLMHSGMLYLVRVFHFDWAGTLLGTGIGPLLIIVGLLAMGLIAIRGWQGKVVEDK